MGVDAEAGSPRLPRRPLGRGNRVESGLRCGRCPPHLGSSAHPRGHGRGERRRRQPGDDGAPSRSRAAASGAFKPFGARRPRRTWQSSVARRSGEDQDGPIFQGGSPMPGPGPTSACSRKWHQAPRSVGQTAPSLPLPAGRRLFHLWCDPAASVTATVTVTILIGISAEQD
jgi:hypothetical protein